MPVAGLSAATDYYVRDASGGTFKLAASAGGAAVDVTDAGNGTHFISNPSAETATVEGLRLAVKMLVRHWYDTRGLAVTGTIITKIPDAVDALLWHRRVFL